MSKPELRIEIPGAQEFCELRVAAGLSPRTIEAAQRGLPNSLHSVCVRDGDRLVGMGRIIGDRGCNYEIVDMAVHPDYQRQGIGYRMMESLMDYLENNAPPTAYICLLADDDAPQLYKKFGFKFTAPRTVGMSLGARLPED